MNSRLRKSRSRLNVVIGDGRNNVRCHSLCGDEGQCVDSGGSSSCSGYAGEGSLGSSVRSRCSSSGSIVSTDV